MNIDFNVNYQINNIEDIEKLYQNLIFYKINGLHALMYYKEYYIELWFGHDGIICEINPDNDYKAPIVNKHEKIEDLILNLKQFFS